MAPRSIANNNQKNAKVIPLFPLNARNAQETDGDHVLLYAISQGDKDAFAVLVRRHSTRFYRLAYRFMRTRSAAEDIVQDAFLKLWERPNLWQADKNTAFTTWFYRIVVNLCLDQLKKKRPAQLGEEVLIEDERETQEETLLAQEKETVLAAHIAQLPERQRVALTLCFYEELSNQEAADSMGVHLKALQSLIMRAKTTLKEKMNFSMENPS